MLTVLRYQIVDAYRQNEQRAANGADGEVKRELLQDYGPWAPCRAGRRAFSSDAFVHSSLLSSPRDYVVLSYVSVSASESG